MELGLLKGLSYDDYAAIPAVRSSHLKGIERSPAHMRANMLAQKETQAMLLGRALHVALLEPGSFHRQYVSAPKLDRRTNAGKAEWAAFQEDHAGKTVLTQDEIGECMALAKAAHGHPIVSALLAAPGLREATLVWQDSATSLFCKARLDLLTTYEGYSTIVDVKTTRDASPMRFSSDAARLGYAIQAAHYLAGADAISPLPRRYFMLALEKDAPHAVAVYEFDAPFLKHGREVCAKALEAHKLAQESGVWAGYPAKVTTLRAPAWLATEADDDDE